jgi:hypothetical protein
VSKYARNNGALFDYMAHVKVSMDKVAYCTLSGVTTHFKFCSVLVAELRDSYEFA